MLFWPTELHTVKHGDEIFVYVPKEEHVAEEKKKEKKKKKKTKKSESDDSVEGGVDLERS